MEILLCKIEYLRQEMYAVALKKGITHPKVLIASQMLDEALNELYKLAFIQKVR